MTTTLHTGNALDILKTLSDNSCDSLVTDPPAGIAFMGRDWDTDKGGRKQWVTWLTEILVEAYRVLKPGAHGLIWALPRTAHWTAWALEDAGFEIRDNIVNHINGQGFPKSLNVGKNIDKAAGAEREVVGHRSIAYVDSPRWGTPNKGGIKNDPDSLYQPGSIQDVEEGGTRPITAPATPEAEEWEGWGTALKPSQEIWWLVRKPLSEHTVAANALKWGTGALNIDATRITTSDNLNEGAYSAGGRANPMSGDEREGKSLGMFEPGSVVASEYQQPKGRWPSNVVFSHIEGESCPDCTGDDSACSTCQGTGEVGGCRRVGTKRVRGTSVPADKPTTAIRRSGVHSEAKGHQTVGREQPVSGHADPDGKETVEAWECVPGCCPVAQLDAQSGLLQSGTVSPHHMRNSTSQPSRGGYEGGFQDVPLMGYGDSGGASRFFYCPKASSKERYFYCRTCKAVYPRKQIRAHTSHDLFQHPTQKSLALMEYLVKLITPPGGTILDPFCGTGTTGVAARDHGFKFVGIDLDPDAIRVAAYRTSNDTEPSLKSTAEPKRPEKTVTLLSLFGRKKA